jgi:hypothetical protein
MLEKVEKFAAQTRLADSMEEQEERPLGLRKSGVIGGGL